MFLGSTRQKSRYIYERHNRNVECIAEAHKTGAFDAGVDVKTASQLFGLTGNNTGGLTLKSAETNNNVLGKVRLQLKKVALVGNGTNDLQNHQITRQCFQTCKSRKNNNKGIYVHPSCHRKHWDQTEPHGPTRHLHARGSPRSHERVHRSRSTVG